MKFLKPDILTSQNLSLEALAFTTSIGRKFRFEKIIFHASAGITETITITHISKQGSSYNNIIRIKQLNNESDYILTPDGENNFLDGDEIKVECTNATAIATIKVIIKTSEISI
jgi:hypothetical protein